MAGKRKANDNLTGTRHPAARTDTTAGNDLAGTSAQTSGPTANAAGDGIAGTSQALAGLTAAATGSAGGSSQFGGALGGGAWSGQRGRGFAPPQRQAFAVGGAAGGAGGGSQPHRRAPHIQMPSQGMPRPPLGNPAVGRAPFPYQYHAPTGNGSVSGPRQTGTGQPRGHSGSGGPSWAISCASAPGAPVPVSPLVEACPRCKRPPTIVFWEWAPLCVDCYAKTVLSNVLEKHPEIRCVHPPRGSGPICQVCGHPLFTGNGACRFCHSNGPPPPPPPPGLG